MSKGLDVNHINPFLQSCISILDQTAHTKITIGKPSLASLTFTNHIFAIQVGLTGDLKGQMFLVMDIEHAKVIASRMMYDTPIQELDELSASALAELSNMIMGNTATLFSMNNIRIDITPPVTFTGIQLHLHSDATALKIPMYENGEEVMSLYLCVVIK